MIFQKCWDKRKIVKLFFWIFLLLGIFARVWRFGVIPADINQDEAFAGYEAYSLLHYGMDSSGHHFPVYLTAWGSGMNALNTYLIIPFMAIFGPKVWVIRLPQLIVSCLTLWVVYFIVKRVVDEKTALAALLLTAICPWHIYMSRWGLESNLAPGFVLFGLYFFIRGLEEKRYLMLSALMYGLSLYTYATIWPVIPLVILSQLVYCMYYKKIVFSKEFVFSGVILGALALPLLLFLFVNYGFINEISTPFFSIPKLVRMRSSEISFSDFWDNAKNLCAVIIKQTNSSFGEFTVTKRYGLFTYYTLPFFFLGIFYYLKKIVEKWKKIEFGLESLILIQLMAGILIGLVINVNITRVNILFLPMLIITATGICWICGFVHRYAVLALLPLYLLQFGLFEHYYFTDFEEEVHAYFDYGIGDAVCNAMEHEGTIYVTSKVKFPKILFYSREPVTDYLETVEYKNYPATFLKVRSYGRFQFGIPEEDIDLDGIYILDESQNPDQFTALGFTLEQYGNFTMAYLEDESR